MSIINTNHVSGFLTGLFTGVVGATLASAGSEHIKATADFLTATVQIEASFENFINDQKNTMLYSAFITSCATSLVLLMKHIKNPDPDLQKQDREEIIGMSVAVATIGAAISIDMPNKAMAMILKIF